MSTVPKTAQTHNAIENNGVTHSLTGSNIYVCVNDQKLLVRNYDVYRERVLTSCEKLIEFRDIKKMLLYNGVAYISLFKFWNVPPSARNFSILIQWYGIQSPNQFYRRVYTPIKSRNKISILIPSGEGKTKLCRNYKILNDPDNIIKSKSTIVKDLAKCKTGIEMNWHIQLTKRVTIFPFLLPRQTCIRENARNRSDIFGEANICTFGERNRLVRQVVQYHLGGPFPDIVYQPRWHHYVYSFDGPFLITPNLFKFPLVKITTDRVYSIIESFPMSAIHRVVIDKQHIDRYINTKGKQLERLLENLKTNPQKLDSNHHTLHNHILHIHLHKNSI